MYTPLCHTLALPCHPPNLLNHRTMFSKNSRSGRSSKHLSNPLLDPSSLDYLFPQPRQIDRFGVFSMFCQWDGTDLICVHIAKLVGDDRVLFGRRDLVFGKELIEVWGRVHRGWVVTDLPDR